MELIRGLHNLKPQHLACVASIGNFDGVHLGHQAIIKQLQREAKKRSVPVLLIIFEPQPQEYFVKGLPPARLTRLREKLQALQHYGVDRVLCIGFNAMFADMSAQTFIHKLLIERLAIQYLAVGDDFRFGKNRSGDYALLEKASQKYLFSLEGVASISQNAERISSTLIRRHLLAGELAQAESLLGRPYSMCGRVAHGDKRGRQWGIPTANVYLHRPVSPLLGVYVVEVFGINKQSYYGVANVGNRPTITGLSIQNKFKCPEPSKFIFFKSTIPRKRTVSVPVEEIVKSEPLTPVILIMPEPCKFRWCKPIFPFKFTSPDVVKSTSIPMELKPVAETSPLPSYFNLCNCRVLIMATMVLTG